MLPSWKLERASSKRQPGCTQRTLTYTDPATGLRVRCDLTEYDDFPAVEWVLHFENRGTQDTPILKKILPLDAEFKAAAQANVVVEHSLGDKNSGQSFAPVEDILTPGSTNELVFAPIGGRSSEGHMPFFNLAWREGGVAMAIGWSGQWEARFHRSAQGALVAQAGQQLVHCKLHPGESIRTPRMLLVFWDGGEPIRGNNLFRQVLMAHYMPRRNGELVLVPHLRQRELDRPGRILRGAALERDAAPGAARHRGVLVGHGPAAMVSEGFPRGHRHLGARPGQIPARAQAHRRRRQGGGPGLPAVVRARAGRIPARALTGNIPSGSCRRKKEWSQLFRLHDEQARRWLTDYIDVQISAGQVRWLRWDFNITPLGFWRRNDASDRQGITEIQHVEGLYAMWDELRARHPGLVIDLCAGGGRRIDLEALTRGVPLWHSDMQCSGKPGGSADQLQNAGLWRWVPMHGCGDFAYEPSYAFRSAMTAGQHPRRRATRRAASARRTRTPRKPSSARWPSTASSGHYMTGDFYPLFPHSESAEAWFGYQFHRPDLKAGAAILFRREKSKDARMPVPLRALDAKRGYEVSFEDTPEKSALPGTALSALPVEISSVPGSVIVYYHTRSK